VFKGDLKLLKGIGESKERKLKEDGYLCMKISENTRLSRMLLNYRK
jgi:hypothetical protein